MSENMKGYFQGLAVGVVIMLALVALNAWLDKNDCPCPKTSNVQSTHRGVRP